MSQRDPYVFDEMTDRADLPILTSEMSWEEMTRALVPRPDTYKVKLSSRTIVFKSIEEAREARTALNGLTLEGKL